MDNKRKLYRKRSKWTSIIGNHVSKNKKEYAIAVLVFFIGIIVGVVLVNSSSQENRNEITRIYR